MTNGYRYGHGYTYTELTKEIENLKNNGVKIQEIGKSLYGRSIPSIWIGNGESSVVYIGAHHGMESITSALLMEFAYTLCKKIDTRVGVEDEQLALALEKKYKFIIIPMLNPDGVTIATQGIYASTEILKREDARFYRAQLQHFNKGNDDFCEWQANGRGVDLNHNYAVGFAEYKEIEVKNGILNGAPTKFSGIYPESEPETHAICQFLRSIRAQLMLTFHSQGEEIYGGEGVANNTFKNSSGKTHYQNPMHTWLPVSRNLRRNFRSVGKFLEKSMKYKLATPKGSAAYGGLTDWHLPTFNRPSYTIEVGQGKNPLPMSDLQKICTKTFFGMTYAPFIIQ